MSTIDYEQDLDRHLERFDRRLPRWCGRFLDWLWQPKMRWVRIPLGVLLVLCGFVGFLPILGFWMIPLGLIILAKDVRPLQPYLVRCLDWVERKWPDKKPDPGVGKAVEPN